jgi:glutamine phosphoribosylpyrophosphate amidotransferase
MPGFFALSIDPKEYKGLFLEDLFWLTFYQQHMGESYAGLATYNDGKIKIRTHRGLFRPNFSTDMDGLEGTMELGHCGDNREPILVDSNLGEFAICFSGNIINQEELVKEYKERGHSFAWAGTDVEIIAKLIAEGDGFVDGIRRMNEKVKGSFSIAVLAHEGVIWPVIPAVAGLWYWEKNKELWQVLSILSVSIIGDSITNVTSIPEKSSCFEEVA